MGIDRIPEVRWGFDNEVGFDNSNNGGSNIEAVETIELSDYPEGYLSQSQKDELAREKKVI